MTESRERLRDRFRATLLERVRTTLAALDHLDGSGVNEDVIKRELHTFKGETRLLGLGAESDVAHAIEEQLPLLFDVNHGEHERVAASIRAALEGLANSLEETDSVERRHATAGPEKVFGNAGGLRPPANVPEREAAESPARRGRWSQVESASVDALCKRLAELSSTYNALHARAVRSLPGRTAGQRGHGVTDLLEDLDHCRNLLDECTEAAWALRLMPVEPTLKELASHAHRLARSAGKDVHVSISAAGVHLESDVLDQLWDTLLHIVHNAVEHGVESSSERGGKEQTASIRISAETNGPSVVFTVEDDGRGVDIDQVLALGIDRGVVPSTAKTLDSAQLLDVLCRQGFSTLSTVSALSGRGVGLDVVRSKVEGLGGSLSLESEFGAGTRFRLKVPFAITKERLLVVAIGDLRMGLPTRVIVSVVALENGAAGASVPNTFRYEDSVLPVRSASRLVGVPVEHEPHAVIVELSSRRWAVRFPTIVGERDLIRSPADPLLARTSLFGATACLDDGALVLIPQLDRFQQLLRRGSDTAPSRPSVPHQRKRRVLVVDDSPVVRDLVAEVLISAGLDVVQAEDGAQGIQRLENSDPDLVLSDIEMPHMDGFELLQAIRRRSQRLPVILLTTRGSLEDRKRATALGANAYLTKSDFRGATLLDTVGRFVDLS